jgi:hypothetical protein
VLELLQMVSLVRPREMVGDAEHDGGIGSRAYEINQVRLVDGHISVRSFA